MISTLTRERSQRGQASCGRPHRQPETKLKSEAVIMASKLPSLGPMLAHRLLEFASYGPLPSCINVYSINRAPAISSYCATVQDVRSCLK